MADTAVRGAVPEQALQAIQKLIREGGYQPGDALGVINELNRLLLQRLGSWERIDDLFAGELMLLDIDAHAPKLSRVSTEIQSLFSHVATRQLTREVSTNE